MLCENTHKRNGISAEFPFVPHVNTCFTAHGTHIGQCTEQLQLQKTKISLLSIKSFPPLSMKCGYQTVVVMLLWKTAAPADTDSTHLTMDFNNNLESQPEASMETS